MRGRKSKLPEVAALLRDELESNWLEVVLVPSRDPECAMRGGCLRVAHSYNADWYTGADNGGALIRRLNASIQSRRSSG